MHRELRSAGLLLLLLLALPWAEASAQDTRTVRGTVVDGETQDPLPGVNIIIQATPMRGTVTDWDGRYTLEMPAGADTLVFSFVGYFRQRVATAGRTVVDVTLQPDIAGLEEVVVVGYGTQQRAKITGAVASISAKEIQDIPAASFENAIQGKLSGVTVQESTGEPGAAPTVRIRGTGTITAGSDPLYVIDGMPISNDLGIQGTLERRRNAFRPPPVNPLAMLNPGDIESIEVLKDASSAAIYGSRGSNGVVLITTKSGRRQGRPVISFNSYVGRQEAAHLPELMNASELIEFTMDARNNNYRQKYGAEPINPRTNEGRPDDGNVLIPEQYVNWDGTDTDWLDVILEPASMASTSLSVLGGADNVGYYLSGGTLQQGGIIDGSGFDRYTLRGNIVADLNDRLEVGARINMAFSDQSRIPASAPYFARPPGIVYSALVHSPVVKPRNADGTPNQLDNQSYLGGGTTTASNPLAIIQGVEESLSMHRTVGNLHASYRLLDGLTVATRFGADLVDYSRSFFRGNSLFYRNATSGDPYGQASSSNSMNWVLENTVAYEALFQGGHEVSAVVGYTAQKETLEAREVLAQNYSDDEITTVNGGQVTGGFSVREAWSLASALGRVNYGYLGRYLVTLTLRSDRSSRFGADNQTGYFPSASLGWRISEEPFMDRYGFVNNLKLRASYGSTGNFLIPNYGAISLLGQNTYPFGGGLSNGVAPSTLGNSDLSWERTNMFDVGVDAAFLDDRIYFTADYYNSITQDLLLFVNVPSALGFSTALTNIGKVLNRGFEFSVTSRNVVGAFNWSTDFNVSHNYNEVLELGDSGDPILSSGGAGLRHITRVGDAIGSYYGYVVDGIYQSQQEIDSAPPDALAPDAAPGDFRFKDVNGDGVINADDRTVTGNYLPDYTFGINNRFDYKGVELSFFIQGTQGNEILNLTSRHMKNGEANFNSYAVFNDRWRSPSEPGNGEIPRADRQSGIHGGNNRPSSFQVEDGSYIRLRNVRLAYTMPRRYLGQRVQTAQVYFSANNLYTWTDYLGFNPEVNNQSLSNTTPGEDYGAYPLSRTYTLGLNLSF